MSTTRYKYPRTPHLAWSLGATSDDVVLGLETRFVSQQVVVTEKLDGENTTIYNDYIHARSIDGRHHPSRNWVKRLQGEIGFKIPPGYRVCGENMYARHSISYDNLDSYFYLFSIWNDQNQCLDWDETLLWAEELGLSVVPELYRGVWDEETIRNISIDCNNTEGYVVRTANAFSYSDFSNHIAKWVRANHVTTDEHWMHKAVVPNNLKPDSHG